jgi:hypothetical protein
MTTIGQIQPDAARTGAGVGRHEHNHDVHAPGRPA